MKTIEISYDDVDLPLTRETINKLGEEHGTSMYIVRVMEENEDTVSITTYILKIFNLFSKIWHGTLDGKYIRENEKSKIIQIAKFSFL